MQNLTVVQHGRRAFEIFSIDDAFTDDELSLFDKIVEENNHDVRPFTYSRFRNGKLHCPDLSTIVWQRLKTCLPTMYVSRFGRNRRLTGTTPFIMFAEMTAGQLFGLHTDTGSVFERGGMRETSHTVLIYLNDDFSGGVTRFVDESFRPVCGIQPKRNRTLCFDIDIFHQGDEVTIGTKRWFGTELVVEDQRLLDVA